jgi:hypothetical protein
MCDKILRTHLHTQNVLVICDQIVAFKNIYIWRNP